ncbi:MAG TPA: ABC transporter substrate-binding protein [Chloroflexota bacterium]|nr:ABC transporter substrate-binding protein [Chloroflexota bacterium]
MGTVLCLVAVTACTAAPPASPTAAPTSPPKPAAAAPTSPATPAAAVPTAAAAAKAAAGQMTTAEEAAWEKQTYEAAKNEGKLVVYGFWNPDLEKVTRDFLAEKYPGIELETLTTTTATDKIRTERQTGQFVVDAYLGGGTTALGLADLGFTEKFAPPAESLAGSQWKVQPSSYMSFPSVVYAIQGKGILINTTLVPKDKEPKKFEDLLDPFWSGKKIVMDHPGRGGGPGGSWARWVSDTPTLGRTFLEGLKAQNPVLDAGSAAPDIDATARGEYAAYLPAYPSSIPQVPGAPVKFIWPEQTGGATPTMVAMMKDAPHPNAAKLYLNMQILPEYQQKISQVLWISPNLLGVAVPDPIVSLEGRNVTVDTEADTKRNTNWANTIGKEIFGQ